MMRGLAACIGNVGDKNICFWGPMYSQELLCIIYKMSRALKQTFQFHFALVILPSNFPPIRTFQLGSILRCCTIVRLGQQFNFPRWCTLPRADAEDPGFSALLALVGFFYGPSLVISVRRHS